MSKILKRLDELEALSGVDIKDPVKFLAANADKLSSFFKLVRALRTTVLGLEKVKVIYITDGCEECSSVWQRRYELKASVEALASAEKDLCGKIKS